MILRSLIPGIGCMLLLCSAGCGETPETELAEARAKVVYIAHWSAGRIEYDKRNPELPIVGLDFSKTQILDSALYYVGKLKSLRVLNLAHCNPITNVGVAYLGELSNLSTLDLEATWTTDSGVRHLIRLTNLRSLNLAENKGVTSHCVPYLKELTRLQRLDLRNTSMSQEGVNQLRAWNMDLEVLHSLPPSQGKK